MQSSSLHIAGLVISTEFHLSCKFPSDLLFLLQVQ